MENYKLFLPDYFDDEAGIIDAKGEFDGAIVEINGRKIRPFFMGIEALHYGFGEFDVVYSANMVIIKTIDRATIEFAVKLIADKNGFAFFAAEE
jgi:hypothetical protein